MVTTVGAVIASDDMIVAQSDEIASGTTVESLVIPFDDAKAMGARQTNRRVASHDDDVFWLSLSQNLNRTY